MGPTSERPRPCPLPCRLMFFEQAREQAEREFKANNKDAMVREAAPPPPPPPGCESASCLLGLHWVAGQGGAGQQMNRSAYCIQPGSANSCCCPSPRAAPSAPALQALTKWGGALLELAHFRQGNEAYDMIEEAIAKFEQVGREGAGPSGVVWGHRGTPKP